MYRWRTLCALLSGLLLMSSAWAQSSESVIVTENGMLMEKTLTGGRMERKPLSGADSVMYLFGRSTATGEILFGREEGNRINLTVVDLFGNKERDLGTEALWATWSPDGYRYIYYDNQGALYQVRDGNRQLLALGVAAAAYSPDGNYLALVRTPDLNEGHNGRAPGLWTLDLRNGEERQLTSRYNETWAMVGYAPYWLPNNRQILFIADGGSTPFWLADTVTGDVEAVQAPTDLPRPASLMYFTADGRRLFYGTEGHDIDDAVWALDLTSLSSGLIEYAQTIRNGNPLGFTQEGQSFLIASEDGTWRVDPTTLDMEKAAEPVDDEFEILGPSGLHRVHYTGPLANPPVWRPTSWFSHNTNRTDGGPYRFDCVNFGRSSHRGTDMGAGLGTRIDAGANGTVDVVSGGCGSTTTCRTSSTSCGGGFGNYIRVRHSNGATTYYAHQSGLVARSGQNVNCHSQLGRVGSTGNSTGCHLHFEVRYVVGGSTRSIDPYGGACNWISGSLWVEFNHPFHCR